MGPFSVLKVYYVQLIARDFLLKSQHSCFVKIGDLKHTKLSENLTDFCFKKFSQISEAKNLKKPYFHHV